MESLTANEYRPLRLVLRAWLVCLVGMFFGTLSLADDLLGELDRAFGQAQKAEAEAPKEAPASETKPAVEDGEREPGKNATKDVAFELNIKTPITASESARARAALNNIQSSNPNATVVIRFASSNEEDLTIGNGSEYEASLAIARVLTGPIGGKIRSLAYVDKPIVGHAVLVVLACERIAVGLDAEVGSAGIDEPVLDETLLIGYKQIAKQRGRFPPAFIESMLNAEAQLYEVQLAGGATEYVNQSALNELTAKNQIIRQDRLSTPGKQGYFSGLSLRAKNLIDFAPDSLEELQITAEIPRIEQSTPTILEEGSSAVVFELKEPITTSVANRCVRALREAVSKKSAKLCVLKIDSLGGTLEECNRLASFLLDLNEDGVRTVALIEGRCRGGAALIAMACNNCYSTVDSDFGGDGEPVYGAELIYERIGLWKNLAGMSRKPESQFYSVISSSVPLLEYTSNAGGRTLATPRLIERGNQEIQWKRVPNGKEIAEVGLDQARSLGWIQGTVRQPSEFAGLLGMEKLPEPVQMSEFEEFVLRLAQNNTLHTLLLFVGIATFTTELTAPGGMIFGFISLLCFSGFFWLKMLNGTVDTLEIVLFVSGIIAICVEVFIIPGIGIFGIGGIIMCMAGLILASQRFVVPVTSVQWNEFAWNFFRVTCVGFGSLILLIAMSSRITNSRVFKKLELQPPVQAEPVAVSSAENLTGKGGTTVTRCSPYGRAKIQGRTHDVRSESSLIEEGREITVVSMQGDTAIVREIDESSEEEIA